MAANRVRALIVDDEPAARRGMRLLLSRHPDVDVVGECASAPEVAPAIRDVKPDVVFLDVRMPGGTGIDAVRGHRSRPLPLVVLVTAFEEHALEAFDIDAIDYLLKPFSDAAFERSLDRVRLQLTRIRAHEINQRVARVVADLPAATMGEGESEPEPAVEMEAAEGESRQTAAAEGEASSPSVGDRIPVRSGGRVRLVDPCEIHWVAAEGDYVRIHTAGGEHLLRETMRALEERLRGEAFIRIHRSTLVRVDHVREVRTRGRGRYVAIFRDGTRRNVSRRGNRRLQDALGIQL